jgi:outer membrane protein assembly factor BamB
LRLAPLRLFLAAIHRIGPDFPEPWHEAFQSRQETTGAERWQVQSRAAPSIDAAVADGLVYFGAWSGPVFALDTATGVQRWQIVAGNDCCSGPTVAGGVVYLGSFDQFVYALDAATGAQRWRFQTGDRVASAPAVANGVVYVSSTISDHFVYALDAEMGRSIGGTRPVECASRRWLRTG